MEAGVIVNLQANSALQVDGQLIGNGTVGNHITINGTPNTPSMVDVFGTSDLKFTDVHVSNMAVSLHILAGDTTGNGVVNASDIGQTKSQSGQAVTSANFRADVVVTGTINASDIALVKSRSGAALAEARTR